ncbi:MAG TPA: HEAT repeat domain-containing protein [Gemmatimonadaceae bacterium]|nr:HEAT repeat domain-containing protein [Gemmatimonadaceae bacterium]
MDLSPTFARHFSRLVSLLIHDAASVDEQKMALRAALAVNKDGAVSLELRGSELRAGDEPIPSVLAGVGDLVERMAANAVTRMHFDKGTSAADMLGTARLLARAVAAGDGGAGLRGALAEMASGSVRVEPEAVASEPEAIAEVPPEPEPLPLQEPEAEPVAQEDAVDALSGAALVTPPGGIEVQDASGVISEARPDPTPSRVTTEIAGLVAEDGGGMFMHFSAANAISDSPESIFERLDRVHGSGEATKLLDDLATLAENAAREGKPVVVADIYHGIVVREAALPEGDIKRAYVLAIRRMAKPTLLRSVAMLLPRRRERLEDYVAVLMRTGEDGADALIEQLTQAQTSEDRRVFFDVLLRLQSGVDALVHMLGDARWFVARNAADLLGEMRAAEAEGPLTELLRHPDDRVRRSATNALMQLSTETALRAIYDAIRDPAPEVRMQAAAAVAARKDGVTASTLIQAIEEEEDGDVQLAMLAALGKVATRDAVDRLVKAAEPERGLFKRKTTAFRIAAVNALAEAKTPAARAALKALESDKDKEVRDTVARVMQFIGRA